MGQSVLIGQRTLFITLQVVLLCLLNTDLIMGLAISAVLKQRLWCVTYLATLEYLTSQVNPIVKAQRLLCLTHHSRPAFQDNVVSAYKLLRDKGRLF